MAIAHRARITRVEYHGKACLLTMKMLEKPLSFFGGQFVIVDTGLTLPTGQKYKRAYSLMGRDRTRSFLQIAVYQFPGGKGSHVLHNKRKDDELVFSGPWGKFHAGGDHFHDEPSFSGGIVIIATDTGITAALGLLRSLHMLPWLERTTLLWFPSHSFIPEETLKQWLPKDLGHVKIFPKGSSPLIEAKRLAERSNTTKFFLCGDGAINHLLEKEYAARKILIGGVEHFFNAPKKAPSQQQKSSTEKSP